MCCTKVLFRCLLCFVFHIQHMNSRRHRERLAGKPMKAKFMPYNKLRSSAVFAVSICPSNINMVRTFQCMYSGIFDYVHQRKCRLM